MKVPVGGDHNDDGQERNPKLLLPQAATSVLSNVALPAFTSEVLSGLGGWMKGIVPSLPMGSSSAAAAAAAKPPQAVKPAAAAAAAQTVKKEDVGPLDIKKDVQEEELATAVKVVRRLLNVRCFNLQIIAIQNNLAVKVLRQVLPHRMRIERIHTFKIGPTSSCALGRSKAGELWKALLESIDILSHLERLDLSGVSLPREALGKLYHMNPSVYLRVFKLGKIHYSPHDDNVVGEDPYLDRLFGFAHFQRLQTLDLSGCQLVGLGVNSLASYLETARPHLQVLKVGCAATTTASSRAAMLHATTRLSMALMSTEDGASSAPNLATLSFGNTAWDTEGMRLLGMALKHDLHKLTTLRFTECELPRPIGSALEDILTYVAPQADQGSAKRLSRLEFSCMRTLPHEEGFYQSVYHPIRHHISQGSLEWLQRLNFTSVGITDELLNTLIDGFKGNQGPSMTIKSLILAKNKLTHVGVENLL